MSEHFHRWNDGRGRRRVTVNGNEVRAAVWADTKRGVVEFYPQPIRLRRDGEIYARRLHGVVVVEPIGG